MNSLKFKDGEYHCIGVSNLFRTEDGRKVFFVDEFHNPIWLSSDSPIHIETRRSEKEL